MKHINTIIAISFLAISALGLSRVSYAQSPAASACDPDYYKSLKAKAWMEAQREITQNQNLIFKPDSVLEYTCFEKHLNVVAKNAASMFSENPRWGGAAAGMAGSLTGLVASPMFSYLQTNFKTSTSGTYGLLGGRSSSNSTMSTPTVIPGDYSCDMMNKIWAESKCMPFISDASNDGFYTLEHYVNNDDKRTYPGQCIKPVGLNTWQSNYDDAVANPPWTHDPVHSFLTELHYNGTATSCSNSTPIPTGIEIFISQGVTRPEKVCVMPGCYYDTVTDACVGVIINP